MSLQDETLVSIIHECRRYCALWRRRERWPTYQPDELVLTTCGDGGEVGFRKIGVLAPNISYTTRSVRRQGAMLESPERSCGPSGICRGG